MQEKLKLKNGKEFIIKKEEFARVTPYSLFLLENLPEFEEDNIIALDFGAGTGIQSIGMSLSGAEKIIGVDIDKKALSLSRENCKNNKIDNANFFMNDDKLPYELAKYEFDFIISNPASLPSDKNLSSFFNAGEFGNKMIFELLDIAEKHLSQSGKLLFIHTSLVPLADTIKYFGLKGFSFGVIKTKKLEFRPFYFDLLPHFQKLKDMGKNFFTYEKGRCYEYLYLIQLDRLLRNGIGSPYDHNI